LPGMAAADKEFRSNADQPIFNFVLVRIGLGQTRRFSPCLGFSEHRNINVNNLTRLHEIDGARDTGR